MQNFDDIKNLWQANEEKSLPDAKEILLQVQRARKKMMLRTIIGGGILIFTFVYILSLAFYYHFEEWTTRAGIIITLLGVLMGILFNTKLAQLLLKQSNVTLSNREYLQQLIAYRNTQQLIQTKGMTAYFILLTSGIALYMAEFAKRDLTFGIIAYSITLGWIALNWFYIRKKTMAKQQKQIDVQIESIEKLVAAMEDEK